MPHTFRNRKYIRKSEYWREFTGCCQPVLTGTVLMSIMDVLLMICGITMLSLGLGIVDKTKKLKNDDDCDKDKMNKVETHIDNVVYISVAMIITPLFSSCALCFLWYYIGGEVEEAVDTKMGADKWIPHYSHVVMVNNVTLACHAVGFACLFLAMGVEGGLFYQDVDKADSKLCTGDEDSKYSQLAEQLRYALIGILTLAGVSVCGMGGSLLYYCSHSNELRSRRTVSGSM